MSHWPTPNPRLSHDSVTKPLGVRAGPRTLTGRVHFCAPCKPAVEAQGHQESSCKPVLHQRRSATRTAPGARPRLPADTSVVGHACSGSPRPGAARRRGLGRTRAGLGALRQLRRARSRSAPWCSLPRLAPAAPSPAFSLSLPLPDPSSPALPPADCSFSRNAGGAQVSPLGRTCSQRRSRMRWAAARTSISAASAATGLSGFRMLRPRALPGRPAQSASPLTGAAIPAGGSAAGLYRGGERDGETGQPTGRGRGSAEGRGNRLQSAQPDTAFTPPPPGPLRAQWGSARSWEAEACARERRPPVRLLNRVAEMESHSRGAQEDRSPGLATEKPTRHTGFTPAAPWAPAARRGRPGASEQAGGRETKRRG